MQENIESFCEYFGIEHCFEFTLTAPRLTPAEFQRRKNSLVTNCLRELMPDRVSVIEPHTSGHAHEHSLVVLPFTSPRFDHEALAASRKAFNRKDFAESKRQWKICWASMSKEHQDMWTLLQKRLPEYGLGKQIGFAPVKECGRAIARYFGKYLAKGIASRPDDWKHVRLVRYSGTNAREVSPWKNSSPQRSGMSLHDTNRRDKMAAVARSCGVNNSEGMKQLLGQRWFFHARELIARVQLPVYRSYWHAESDGLTLPLDLETIPRRTVLLVDVDMSKEGTAFLFPEEYNLPYRPPANVRRSDALTPKEVADAILTKAAPFREAVRQLVKPHEVSS